MEAKGVLSLPSRVVGRIRRMVVPEHKRRAADQIRGLGRLPKVSGADGSRLREVTASDITQIMASPELKAEFAKVEDIVAATGNIPGLSASSKRPTQYGLYFLVRAFSAGSVLEIGTNLGCSAGFMGLALSRNQELGHCETPRLVTVDMLDVNDEDINLWGRAGSPISPAQFIDEVECNNVVEFVTAPSVDYLKSCTEKFDFIFLDGSHDAWVVYQELPEVLRLVNDGGVIAMHDYNPIYGDLEPVDRRIPGPFLAVRRFLQEGTKFRVLHTVIPFWPSEEAPRPMNLVLLTKDI